MSQLWLVLSLFEHLRLEQQTILAESWTTRAQPPPIINRSFAVAPLPASRDAHPARQPFPGTHHSEGRASVVDAYLEGP